MFPLFARKTSSLKPPTVTFISSASSTSTAASVNFGSFSIPKAGMVVVFAWSYGGNSRYIASISIGGSAGTLQQYMLNDGLRRGFAYRSVAAGSANVTVTLTGTSGSNSYWNISVFLVEGMSETAPYASTISDAVEGTSTSATMSMTAGSVALYSAVTIAAAPTWSSATQLDISFYDYTYFTVASKLVVTTGSHTETISTGTPSYFTIMGMAWR